MEAIYVEVGGGASLGDILEKLPRAQPGEYDIADWVSDEGACGRWQYGSNREGFTTFARLVHVTPDTREELEAITGALGTAAKAFGGSCGHCPIGAQPRRCLGDMLDACRRFG